MIYTNDDQRNFDNLKVLQGSIRQVRFIAIIIG